MTRPLLFVHGFLGDPEDWSPLRRALAPAPTAAFELPGHGTCPCPPAAAADDRAAHWFPATARRLAAACAALGPPPPILVGYSMGGRVALYTALRHAPAAGGLVLLGADPGIDDSATRSRRRARDAVLARQLECADGAAFGAWLDRWYAVPLFATLRAHPSFPALLRRRRRQPPVHLAAALRGLSVAVQPSLWSALPRLPIPALFIAGAEDDKYRAVGARIAALGGPWRTAVCPAAGHAVHLEQPAAVAALIRGFAGRPGAPAVRNR